jgi:hypothetical protein
LYCEKNKEIIGDWLQYFYEYNGTEIECSLNGITDPDGTKRSNIINRFKHYTDHLENVNNEVSNIHKYNCYLNQITDYYI